MSPQYRSWKSISSIQRFFVHNGATISNHEMMSHLCTTTQQLLCIGESILLHVCLDDIVVWISCCNVQSLAIDILHGTSSIDLFIRGIIPAKPKEVPWHSRSVSILSATQHNLQTRTSTSNIAASHDKPSINDVASSHQICTAWEILLNPHRKPYDFVITTASGHDTIEPEYSKDLIEARLLLMTWLMFYHRNCSVSL